MAVARTGVFVDDYLEYSSTLPAELQRLLNTVRELDERSQSMMNQTRQQTKYYRLGYAPQDDSLFKEIESNQDNALSLCTEKVLLARQAHDLIDSHIRRLDQDLNSFAEDLKQEGKIAQDEPALLPPLPLYPRVEKQKSVYGTGTPFTRRIEFRDREDRDLELMPPPGSVKREYDVKPDEFNEVKADEPLYCVCNQVSFGDMIACDNDTCIGGEWFHYECVGLSPETRFKEKWYCPACTREMRGESLL